MLPVSAQELASIQADAVAAVCDKTCYLYAKTGETQDAYGSPIATHATTPVQTVAGMAQPTAGELANYDYEIGDKATWKVQLPVSIAVNHNDHLVIDGQLLEVQILLNPRSYEVFHSVLAVEIK